MTFFLTSTPLVGFSSFWANWGFQTLGYPNLNSNSIISHILDINIHFWPFPQLPHLWLDFLCFLGKLGVSNIALSKSELKLKKFSKFWILMSIFDLFPNFHTFGWIFFVFWAYLVLKMLLYPNLHSKFKKFQNFGF